MRKCVIVSDTFKGTLSSQEICDIARQSVPRFFPECEVVTVPVADGGEGTVDCFIEALHARPVSVTVSGPFWKPVEAVYARSGHKAVIEMASAAGLPFEGEEKNPETSTTYGVGQLIRHAVDSGATEILLGLGGSATNDGGCGCAAALGTRFYNAAGELFVPTGGSLDQIARIDVAQTRQLLKGIRLTAMCDIKNALYGPAGAAYIFGPQKGADAEMVQRLDGRLRYLADMIRQELGLDLAQYPGTGAAGGMGAGCMAFLQAELKPGIEAILDMVDFDSHLENADLVITGEGRIDAQSINGKVVSGVARRTQPRGIPLIAIVGSIADSAVSAYDLGVTAIFGTDREAVDFRKCIHKSGENYQRTLEDILRLIQAVEAGVSA